MKLTRLLYVSTITEKFKKLAIQDILEHAQQRNAAEGVSGILYFNNTHFMQCLEGQREVVNRIYNTIVRDDRHSNVVLLDYKPIHSRDFAEWSMAYVPNTTKTKAITFKYSYMTDFNPYDLHGKNAYLMLLELRQLVVSA